jgi:hypothetical protein
MPFLNVFHGASTIPFGSRCRLTLEASTGGAQCGARRWPRRWRVTSSPHCIESISKRGSDESQWSWCDLVCYMNACVICVCYEVSLCYLGMAVRVSAHTWALDPTGMGSFLHPRVEPAQKWVQVWVSFFTRGCTRYLENPKSNSKKTQKLKFLDALSSCETQKKPETQKKNPKT